MVGFHSFCLGLISFAVNVGQHVNHNLINVIQDLFQWMWTHGLGLFNFHWGRTQGVLAGKSSWSLDPKGLWRLFSSSLPCFLVVCHAEKASGFNHSAVNELMLGVFNERMEAGPPTRNTQPTKPTPPPKQMRPDEPTRTNAPTRPDELPHRMKDGRRGKRAAPMDHSPAQQHPTPSPPSDATQPTRPTGTVWTLYGLFQLSDHLACKGTTPSPNICGLNCTGEFMGIS